MAEYLSPGVYVEEYDNSPRTVEGAGTSTAGFVGMAAKGPVVGAPEFIGSFGEFQKRFGGFLSEYTHGEYRYLAYSVEQFFVNGGTRCYVSRVIAEDAVCAEGKQGILSLKAVDEGKWGSKILVHITEVSRKKIQLLEKLGERTYRAKSTDGFREGDLVCLVDEFNQISSITEEAIIFEREFKEDPVDQALIPGKVLKSLELNIAVSYEDQTENYAGVTLNMLSPNYIEKRMSASELVQVSVEADGEIKNPLTAIFGEGQISGTITLAGGSDGSISKIGADTFIGQDKGPGMRSGIQSFMENSTVSMMAVPGVTIPEVMVSLIAHCETCHNRFAVLDMPKEMTKPKDLVVYRSMVDSTFAAMYHPWIQVFDRGARKPGMIPPSGSVLGVYARTDSARGVHKAPANETVSCTGLAVNYTKVEQDILNPEGINLIRAIPGQGIRVWGARTASSNSTFRYVNVRRLFIFVEESIKNNTSWVVFEPNDTSLWARVQLTISAFLDTLWRNGVLSGASPQEAFFVEVGPGTMSKDDIMAGRLICNVGIAPSRPAEFVIFRVTQHTAEASAAAEG